MLHVFVDPRYNVILGYNHHVRMEGLDGVLCTPEVRGHPRYPNPNVYCIEDEEKIQKILSNHEKWLMDPETEELKVRPYIDVSFLYDSQIVAGNRYLPVGKDVEVLIKYVDPDNVDFRQHFKTIKVKDREEFCIVRDRFVEMDDNNEARTVIRSDFPGVSRIRAKDELYICGFSVHHIRFKQGV